MASAQNNKHIQTVIMKGRNILCNEYLSIVNNEKHIL